MVPEKAMADVNVLMATRENCVMIVKQDTGRLWRTHHTRIVKVSPFGQNLFEGHFQPFEKRNSKDQILARL